MNKSGHTRHFYLLCLAARSAAFVFLVAYVLIAPERFDTDLAAPLGRITPLSVVWLLLMLSMAVRLFPSKSESLGCQKEFARRFRPTGLLPSSQEIHHANRGAAVVLAVWIASNAVVFGLHFQGWLSQRAMVCLAGFYGVCDIVCILFFCPFQAWMMHNRCCTTCRIYNCDYLMLCTPLLPLTGPLTRLACLLATVLFVRWELTYHFRRERFFESSNQALQCSQCQEHLCRYKRQLTRMMHSRF